jgi:hypothetical protein
MTPCRTFAITGVIGLMHHYRCSKVGLPTNFRGLPKTWASTDSVRGL